MQTRGQKRLDVQLPSGGVLRVQLVRSGCGATGGSHNRRVAAMSPKGGTIGLRTARETSSLGALANWGLRDAMVNRCLRGALLHGSGLQGALANRGLRDAFANSGVQGALLQWLAG